VELPRGSALGAHGSLKNEQMTQLHWVLDEVIPISLTTDVVCVVRCVTENSSTLIQCKWKCYNTTKWVSTFVPNLPRFTYARVLCVPTLCDCLEKRTRAQ
jgi:hypothetical protein